MRKHKPKFNSFKATFDQLESISNVSARAIWPYFKEVIPNTSLTKIFALEE